MRGPLISLLACLFCLAACGGGGSGVSAGGSSGGGGGGTGSNVQAVVVDQGPPGLGNTADVNILFTSVTVCVPGSTTCQTIDHIQVDTGSSGLRIISSVLSLSLPLLADAGNNALVECTQFVDGYSWGPLRQADVKIGGETAAGLAIQVIGDSAYPNVPSGCSSTGTAESTVAAFGANGVLGIGTFIQDCGPGCAQNASNGIYYACPTNTTCAQAAVPADQQVSNPVASFATDNNGISITLPAVSGSGAASVSGSLTFGVGTQGNNALGSAAIYTVDPNLGSLKTTYQSTNLTDSFIDSGSNALYFPDSSIATCASNTAAPGFYCPPSTLNLTATIQGLNGTSAPVSFSVANAVSLFSTSSTVTAASNLAAPSTTASGGSDQFNGSTSFDWGLPFYYGRTVYTVLEGRTAGGTAGPYFAF